MEAITKADFQRLERKINMLSEKLHKPIWVKVKVITSLTGWNNEEMRQARENGYIQYEARKKNGKNEYWYNLNSLDTRFYQKNAA